jgi:hypothetical protein
MTNTENHKPPEPSKGDAAYTLVKAGIASIPIFGGAGVEIFAALVSSPLEMRRQEWMEEVGKALGMLEKEKRISLEELRENDAFIDTVLLASQAALRNSQADKKTALRNAILNSALPHAPDESLRQFFVSLVDTFTVWHIRILKLFQDPAKWAQVNDHQFPRVYTSSLFLVLESAFPELGGRRSFYDQLWKDLYARGLVNTDGLHTMMTATGIMARRTSDLGNQFLNFIEKPE